MTPGKVAAFGDECYAVLLICKLELRRWSTDTRWYQFVSMKWRLSSSTTFFFFFVIITIIIRCWVSEVHIAHIKEICTEKCKSEYSWFPFSRLKS